MGMKKGKKHYTSSVKAEIIEKDKPDKDYVIAGFIAKCQEKTKSKSA